jgi:hypothetical protein
MTRSARKVSRLACTKMKKSNPCANIAQAAIQSKNVYPGVTINRTRSIQIKKRHVCVVCVELLISLSRRPPKQLYIYFRDSDSSRNANAAKEQQSFEITSRYSIINFPLLLLSLSLSITLAIAIAPSTIFTGLYISDALERLEKIHANSNHTNNVHPVQPRTRRAAPLCGPGQETSPAAGSR